jgi:hypothetical protein
MKINTKYNIKDKVYIEALNLEGKITSIYIDSVGSSYNVRYFFESKPCSCNFEEDEISVNLPEKKIGLAP